MPVTVYCRVCDKPFDVPPCRRNKAKFCGKPCELDERRSRDHPVCVIPGCGKRMLARGWCCHHYNRWKANGHPLAQVQPQGTLAERTWAKIEHGNGCWMWKGGISRGGYGVIYEGPAQPGIRGRSLIAHRVVWELTYGNHPCLRGPMLPGIVVCHRCDVRACVRPDHLFLSDHDGNMADRDAKGRTLRGRNNGNWKHGRYQRTR